MSLANRIEALLFTRDSALSTKMLSVVFNAEITEIESALQTLNLRYQDSAIALVEVASGWRLQLREAHFADILLLAEAQPPRYSRAFWETLAYIAYHQPVTRAEIDAVRGVASSSGIYRQLFDLEWIQVVGRREVPGRPELLGTTTLFLDDFGLQSPADLPPLPSLGMAQGNEDETTI